MKVYRIKHKPSGLYYCRYAKKLTKDGSVYDINVLCLLTFSIVKDKYRKQYTPDEFEIKEYDLED